MDADDSVIRVGRTLWNVWCYVSGAVTRFFRPEPVNIVNNDADSSQASTVNSEPANNSEADDNMGGREVDEQPLAKVTYERPVVAWEGCLTDTKEESKGREAFDTQEGQVAQAGNYDTELLICKEAKKDEQEGEDEFGAQMSCSLRQDEMQGADDKEDASTVMLIAVGEAVSEDGKENSRKAGLENKTERTVMLDDYQKMDETQAKSQEKEREKYKMLYEDKQDLETEDTEQLCITADLSLKEEGNIEEARLQKDEADTIAMQHKVEVSDGALLLASENENKSKEEKRQEHQLSDPDSFEGEPSCTPVCDDLQNASETSYTVSEDGGGQESMTVLRRSDSVGEDGKEAEDEGYVLGASDKQLIDEQDTSEEEGQKEHISALRVPCSAGVMLTAKTVEFEPEFETENQAEDQTGSSEFDEKRRLSKVTLERPVVAWEVSSTDFNQEPKEEISDRETSDEDYGTREEQVAQAENNDAELLVCKDTSEDEQEEHGFQALRTLQDETQVGDEDEHVSTLAFRATGEAVSEDNEENIRKTGAEYIIERAQLLEDAQKMEKTNIQQMEREGDRMPHEHKQEFDAEVEEESEKAVTFDDHQRMDETRTEFQEKEREVGEISHEDEQELQAEDTDVEEVSETAYTLDEDHGMHETKTKDQENEKEGEQELESEERDELESEAGDGDVEAESETTVILDDQKMDETKATIQEKEREYDIIPHGDVEAEDGDVESQTVTLDDSQKMDETQTEIQERESKEEDELESEAEDGDVEAESETTVTLDDHQKADKTETEIQEKDSEEEKRPHEDELELEAEDGDVEVELQTTMTLDDHQKTDKTQREMQEEESEEEDEPESEAEDDDVESETTVTLDDQEVNQTKTNVEEEEMEDDQMPLEDKQEMEEEESEVVEDTEEAMAADDHQKDEVAQETIKPLKTRKNHDAETENQVTDEKSAISEDEQFLAVYGLEEKGLCSGLENKECYIKAEFAATSVTVNPEGETGQEISKEFKNIPLEICEGRPVVLPELNYPAYEETKERVPGYNNVLEAEENTTQRFLEGGDEEIQDTQLPEEVECKELETLQNSGCSMGPEHFLAREHTEEQQESTGEINICFVLEQEQPGVLNLPGETDTPLVPPISEEPEHFFEKEGEPFDSMKTRIQHLGKESEMHFRFTDETENTTKELQDESEEPPIESEAEERLCEFQEDEATRDEVAGAVVAPEEDQTVKSLVSEAQTVTETCADAINSKINSCNLADFTESGVLKQLEPELHDDSAVEMQDAGIDVKDVSYGLEEDEAQNEKETEISTPAPTTEWTEKEIISITESETSETQNQLLDELFKISNKEPEEADRSMTNESKPEDVTVTTPEENAKPVTESEESYHAEETVCLISGHRDVIDEEILDLWIETAMSEDTASLEDVPEPGQQTDTQIEPSNEVQGETSSVQAENDKEQLSQPNSVESVSECETGKSGSQLLKSTSKDTFQDILDKMSDSPGIPDVYTQEPTPEIQDVLMEEAAEREQSHRKGEESVTETAFDPESGRTSPEALPLDEEADQMPEERDEEMESHIAAQDASCKDTEEDVDSMTQSNTLSEVEDEIQRADTGQPRSHPEVSLEGSGDDICTDSREKLSELSSLDKPQPEVTIDSVPGLNSDIKTEQPWTEFEDQMKVDTPVLDFTVQKSRIAVKNPQVRPPKDPRSLLNMPSVDPTPSPQLPRAPPKGVPLGGMGIGIKLPGLGAGFPVLKKTPRTVKNETSQEIPSKESETKPEEKSDSPKQDEPQRRPKWMPPRQPGFGNPLMSELKSKLKKTTEE